MGISRRGTPLWDERSARATYWLGGQSSSPACSKHDFGDGEWVLAARHRNPDGSVGGWVARSAYVDPRATVGWAASVSGEARVFGHSQVLDNASISGSAQLRDGAVVNGGRHVGGYDVVA